MYNIKVNNNFNEKETQNVLAFAFEKAVTVDKQLDILKPFSNNPKSGKSRASLVLLLRFVQSSRYA